MTYNVLMGTLNPTHSLSHSLPLHRLFAALKSIMVWHSGTCLTRTSWYTGFSMKTRGCVNTLQGRSFHKYVHSTVSGSQQIQEKECVFLVSVFFSVEHFGLGQVARRSPKQEPWWLPVRDFLPAHPTVSKHQRNQKLCAWWHNMPPPPASW